MTVYVDDARIPYGRMLMCRMVGDTEAELHAMATAIGIHVKHFHDGHYNICQEKRAVAVRHGAVEITRRHAVVVRNDLLRRAAA